MQSLQIYKKREKNIEIITPAGACVIKLFTAVITSLSVYPVKIIEKYAASGIIKAVKSL